MKGLFLDNFYKTVSNMKLFAPLVLLAAIFLLITGDFIGLEIFVCISITALSIPAVSSMRKDSEAKWNKYELTLPITRNQIIKCKYNCYLFWIAIGTAIASIVTILAVLIHGNIFFTYGLQDILSLFALGIGIAMLVGALFYPMAYLFGSDKSETLLAISVIGGIGIAIFLVWLVNVIFPVKKTDEIQYYLGLAAFVITYILIFVASHLFTQKIYSKKEY